jgi:dTDP-4-amino-4,6-dideoxygalactose transaminase
MKEQSTVNTLAINGGTPVRTRPFPTWPIFDAQEEKAVVEAVRSEKWGLGGTKIPEFEEKFAAYQSAKYGICVANGTVSLIVALKAAGVKYGDEVIVPPYTFMATASAVLEVGAIPVFVDIDPHTFCLDPNKIEAAITAKTKAIIPVHLGGHTADMDRIMEIAEYRNLLVIEDAAHAHGAEWKGVRVGAIGHMGSFSFQSSKNLCCGEGGIIVTNHEEYADKCYSYHNCGRIRGGAKYEHHLLGQNYRMGEFQGAILLAQFARFDAQTDRRNENGKYLAARLLEIGGVIPQARDPRVTRHGFHLFITRYDKETFWGLDRNTFMKAINAEGIPFTAGYSLLYKEPLFTAQGGDYLNVSCPVSEAFAGQDLWLNQAVLLGDRQDMDDILDAVIKVKAHCKELAG